MSLVPRVVGRDTTFIDPKRGNSHEERMAERTEVVAKRQASWRTICIAGGGAAALFAAWRNRDRLVDAATGIQETLEDRGETLWQRLAELADNCLSKFHEAFVSAAPPATLESEVSPISTSHSLYAIAHALAPVYASAVEQRQALQLQSW